MLPMAPAGRHPPNQPAGVTCGGSGVGGSVMRLQEIEELQLADAIQSLAEKGLVVIEPSQDEREGPTVRLTEAGWAYVPEEAR